MGHSTHVSISNDFWHEIAADPQALVDAISVGMNSGTADWRSHSPIQATFDAKDGRKPYPARAPQGVTVHRAQHNDTPQVIASTYGSHAIAAHELPYAIQNGWLDLNPYNAKHAEAVAYELHRLARQIRRAVRDQASPS